MFRKPFFDRKVILLALLATGLHLFSLRSDWVERFYTQGLYPPVSVLLRTLFGWIPFSAGDLLYILAGGWMVWGLVKVVRRLRAPGGRKRYLAATGRLVLMRLLVIYLLFQLLWGLNYSRMGAAAQLQMEVLPYTLHDLGIVAEQLMVRLHQTAPQVDTSGRKQLNKTEVLAEAGIAAYGEAVKVHPFLHYRRPSVKASMFTPLGHFVGFTGYYNPFTAEAQIKTSIPVFLKPFVVTHEMAHQLGYAKENEANFIAFLTSKASTNKEVRYAAYFELFLYTLADLRRSDSLMAQRYHDTAPQQVRRDLEELGAYLERSRNPIEPYMARIYDAYLRWNNQPKGRMSYSEVVAWVVAYGKKYGKQAI